MMHPPPGRGGHPGGRGKIDPKDVEQLRESPVSLRRIGALFAPYRRQIALVVVLIVASSAVSLATPFLVRAVIDDAIPHQNVSLLLWAVGGMLAVTVISSLFGVVQTWISTTVGQRIMHGLRTRVFSHLQRQSLSFFTRTRGGEIQSRLTNDIGGMQSVVTTTATSLAANITTVVGTAIAMAVLSWRLSLLSLIVLPPAIWLTRRVAQMRRAITTRQQRRLADIQTQIDEGLSVSGVLLGKTLGTGPALADKFAKTSADLADLEVQAQLSGRWRMATMNIVFAAIPAVLYLVAGLPATSGGMTIGTLVAFTGLQGALFRPLMSLLDVGVSVTSSLALFSRIFEYLDLAVDIEEPAHPVPVDPEKISGRVRFENLGFRYEGAHRLALEGIDLEIPAGAQVALVGETGSGKTTLGSLMARLYDPTSGRVTIDGIDLRDMRLADVAALVGVVSQETYLLHATVRENLRYARPDATDAEIEDAARAAHIHDLITSLPDGYDTVVGARGHRFSGGEKQRMAIARTLLRDPRILVLDEATSALDNDTERAVQQALDNARAGRTTITIAHRLSTVRDADEIVVLDHGRIIERGTHDALVARGGKYAALARRDGRTLAEHTDRSVGV
ncbi:MULTISPECIES: ABC transporter ATP-binding protein [unclassified Rhodococcus (in: high G+C Gram-positive bacteria)]|uniref:ABC transporter ATP-binding protein n=1 Tax=unclassified Rhodococcus (in: high G+C Gram-positive bacteria) TaxID=192944 RepID=UPI00146F228E|nr:MULTISPECIES: ABC transporter ATP-binding protein [unclassified Rhodococcus (in: high G+C Gram-positive bacteria)]MBF0663505.1 ABC transporter ATP-binding protein [Rhodococcus sp. (in: high G+C Gram-positive bacteria)]NME78986.1 ABC transporter ATP-binding protein [Rhodococcus sp. 105337]